LNQRDQPIAPKSGSQKEKKTAAEEEKILEKKAKEAEEIKKEASPVPIPIAPPNKKPEGLGKNESMNKLITFPYPNRIMKIIRFIFVLPSINEENRKIQKTILQNIFQDYSFGSKLGKIYGFLNSLKFFYLAFFLVFAPSEPLIALVGFTIFSLISLGSTIFCEVFNQIWCKIQSLATDILMIAFCIVLMIVIKYDEKSIEVELDRMIMGYILLCINYLFYILFIINIVVLGWRTVRDFLEKCKKRKMKKQNLEENAQHPE